MKKINFSKKDIGRLGIISFGDLGHEYPQSDLRRATIAPFVQLRSVKKNSVTFSFVTEGYGYAESVKIQKTAFERGMLLLRWISSQPEEKIL